MKYSFYLLISLLLISCGEKSSSTSTTKEISQKEQEPLVVENTIEGQYLAKLLPINSHLTGALDGATTISIEEDEFIGDVRFFGNLQTAQISFEQSLHIGTRCPTLADDLNQDGILDEVETLAVVQETLIPLDADLNTQWLGMGIYPLSDSFGSYYYSQMASLAKLTADLWEVDINLEDSLVKLPPQQEPVFEHKVALIRGISPSTSLPASVRSQNRRGVHAGFPIMCGTLEKITSLPGRRNVDRYPFPSDEGENSDDGATIGIPKDDTTPDYDIEPTGPITNYGD